jgi:hypothetical protein
MKMTDFRRRELTSVAYKAPRATGCQMLTLGAWLQMIIVWNISHLGVLDLLRDSFVTSCRK